MGFNVSDLEKYLIEDGAPKGIIKKVKTSQGGQKIICSISDAYTDIDHSYHIRAAESQGSAEVIGNRVIDCGMDLAKQIAGDFGVTIVPTRFGPLFGVSVNEQELYSGVVIVYGAERAFFSRKPTCS